MCVPDKQVQIEGVEQVNGGAPAGCCADGTERRFAQPADFLECPGNLFGARAVDLEPAAVNQPLARGKSVDFGFQHCPWNCINHCGCASGRRQRGAVGPRYDSRDQTPEVCVEESGKYGIPHRRLAALGALSPVAMEPLPPTPQVVAASPKKRGE